MLTAKQSSISSQGEGDGSSKGPFDSVRIEKLFIDLVQQRRKVPLTPSRPWSAGRIDPARGVWHGIANYL